jgi:hypothetical protein
MLTQLGCKLFRSRKMKESSLRASLSKYRRTTTVQEVPSPLVENVDEFRVSHGVVRFTYVYDFVFPIPYRDTTQNVIRTASAEVGIIDPPSENLYFIYASSGVADAVSLRLGIALAGRDDFVTGIDVPSKRIKEIIDEDAVEVKYGWWDGIDTYARKGALKGNVTKSKYYTAFKKADPTTVTIESKSIGRTVKITTRGTLTLYGKDVKPADVEKYATDVVLGDA